MLAVVLAAALTGCGSSSTSNTSTGKNSAATSPAAPTATVVTGTTTTVEQLLPGTGRPPITIGDKNFTEQFILGQLYDQALSAQGYTVNLDRNIGSTEVIQLALATGQLDMYPEYLGTFNTDIAGDTSVYPTARDEFAAARHYATGHGLQLLQPTPFSDTNAIAVMSAYAAENHLRLIGDLGRMESNLTLGAPPQFQQQQSGLPGIESAYGVTPARFQPLAIGLQYQALQSGSVQAADVFTTDGQLATGQYRLLGDPAHVFAFQNVVPVVTEAAVLSEGPAFVDTINAVSATLTTEAMRLLNADVDLYNQTPAEAAHQFLLQHGFLNG
jgi:osmoprotectant transport system substrate-binding protein